MKVGRLSSDPLNKLRNRLVSKQCLAVSPHAGEHRIGEIGMDGFVTNRMDGHGITSPFRFGDGMMPLDFGAERASAQPAG